MSKFKFSIILFAYNSENWISQSIDSIIHQTLDFKKNIELIIINNGSKDNTHKICEEYRLKYPDNINYILKRHDNDGINKNLGIKRSNGEYLSFLNAEDYYSPNTLKEVLNLFEKHENIEIISIKPAFLEQMTKNEDFLLKYKTARVINLLENPQFYQVQTNTCFFKKTTFNNINFSNQLKMVEEIVTINKKLINNPYLGICSNCKYYNRFPLDNNSILNVIPTSKEFDKEDIEYYFKSLITCSLKKYTFVPHFIQNILLYYFNEVIVNEKIYEILTTEEIENITHEMKEMLKYIDDERIYNNNIMDIKIKTFILFLKNDYRYPEKDQNKLIEQLKLNIVYIDIYEIINDELYILANINSINSDEEIYVYVNNKKIQTKKVEFPQREKYYLNKKYLLNNTFEFRIKLEENKKYSIEFKSSINEKIHIDFSRPCNFSKVGGYAQTKKFISYLDNDQIIITKKKTSSWIKREVKTLAKMLKNRTSGFETAIPIRIIYMLLYPFLKDKRIWFYMDFPTIADDNGMHLFKYSMQQDEKEIKKYFIIDKKSPDYKKMKNIGPTLAYHSLKHRILGLFAEKIITSHPDNNYIYAFWGHYPNFAGLLKSSTIFLQHGITLNNISSWLNKFDKNLDFLLTASKKEYDSLFNYYYNYEKDIIHLLGFPRFDNLKNDKTKTILLMPSWRRYLNHENKNTISTSSYFKTYNSLINNPKLIKIAKKYGYKIIFRPHPHVYEFIELFNENEYVKIDYKRESYQELFKKGALLITDYSSVAFDFAYLKKPVLYFQYGEDYHFNLEESYFNYETMGFGEICDNQDDLINLITEYVENDCMMKDKHIQNVNDYFTFTDKNNCKRVHEAIKKVSPRD